MKKTFFKILNVLRKAPACTNTNINIVVKTNAYKHIYKHTQTKTHTHTYIYTPLHYWQTQSHISSFYFARLVLAAKKKKREKLNRDSLKHSSHWQS